LESVRKISSINKRIVVIDDCSTDDSVSIIGSFIEANDYDNEITFIKKAENRGVIDSLNVFISLTTTEYIYLMASDDIAVSSGVEKIVGILEANKNLQFVVGGGDNLFPNGSKTPIYRKKHNRFFQLSSVDRFYRLFLDSPSPILSQSTIIRTSAIKYIGGWDRNLIADDYAMFIKLFIAFPERGHDFEYFPEIIVVNYRHHEQNTYKNLENGFRLRIQTLESLAPKHLKMRAIGYCLAYYLLYSIAKAQMGNLLKLFLLTPKRSLGWAIVGFIKLAYNGLKEKCVI
jgi:glycosyltransferase involved in cell wall biosynthesis